MTLSTDGKKKKKIWNGAQISELHFIPFVRNEETIGVNLVDFSVEYFEILLTDFRFSTLSDWGFIFKYIQVFF